MEELRDDVHGELLKRQADIENQLEELNAIIERDIITDLKEHAHQL